MRVRSLQLENFRSFEKTPEIQLDAITVLIGANNAGKSSILKSLYLMQTGGGSGYADVRAGAGVAKVSCLLRDVSNENWEISSKAQLTIRIESQDRKSGSIRLQLATSPENYRGVNQLPSVEPHHFIIPYLSKRKTASYAEDVRRNHAMQVQPSMSNLAAKLSRISNPGYPHYARYSKTCEAVVGFLVTAIPSDSGQLPGAYLPSGETLPIDQMGEGVPNIVALLADLAGASNKLFLIEEPENDLHPTALKALLDLIVESSQSNQFVVSTHSNIVLRHLGAAKHSRVYEVTSSSLSLPITSEIRAVDTTPEARLHVLQQLGYSLSDFDLWDGWLFLEEASAERIIRDYLIPWFAPKLKRVRTMSVGGVGKLEPAFEDFHRLTRFTHLENAYSGSTWVRADGDPIGQELIERLRIAYTTWPPDRFGCFSKHSFELYYPTVFKDRIESILAIGDRQRKRAEKRGLLSEVVKWLDADHERAKSALAESAKEIIDDLRTIESQLIAQTTAARQP